MFMSDPPPHLNDPPRYQVEQTYQWNYDHSPRYEALPRANAASRESDAASRSGWPNPVDFCGLPVDSPLGIAAGPLLNGAWCLAYAELGFDVLTYKTVRSRSRPCYPLPNLQPVVVDQLSDSRKTLPASSDFQGSWAVSFGMPSQDPETWRRDIQWTRDRLPVGKLLNVSVVGSEQPGDSLARLASDYAQCARWAKESGADTVEANFSCPNVCSADGQLYQSPSAAAEVAQTIAAELDGTPLIVKIGLIEEPALIPELLGSLSPWVAALSMTNSISARVLQADGTALFEGQKRGICGDAIRQASVEQVRRFQLAESELRTGIRLIGVGGASQRVHVEQYLAAGAHAVHFATGAMLDPLLARRVKEQMAGTVSSG